MEVTVADATAEHVHALGAFRPPQRLADPHRLAKIAGRLIGCPTAAIRLGPRRDPIFGLANELDTSQHGAATFADATISYGETLVVCDTQRDKRFSHFLEVRFFPSVRFVIGVPLRTLDGRPIGALTLFDYRVRPRPSDETLEDVETIACAIAAILDVDDPFN